MRILVHIEIPEDGIDLFLAYEEQVLPLIPNHGGKLISRYQSENGEEEFHVLEWPSPEQFENYKNDPQRLAVEPLWDHSGATARTVNIQN